MFLFNNVNTTGALHAIKRKQAKHMKLSIIDKKKHTSADHNGEVSETLRLIYQLQS